MTAAFDPSALGWHADWLVDYAEDRASATYLEMLGLQDRLVRDERGLLFWERAGLGLAGDVLWSMDGIEEPVFIQQAQLTAIEIYLRRLHRLASTLPTGGSA